MSPNINVAVKAKLFALRGSSGYLTLKIELKPGLSL